MTIPILAGLGAIADRYQALILDLWGVAHDGHEPFEGSLDCLAKLRAEGKQVLFLSNAPRGRERIIPFLADMGIVEGRHFDVLISSGDVARETLARRDDPWHAALGRRYFHLGPERDEGLLDGLDYRAEPSLERAEFILNTGLFDDETEGVEDYAAIFAQALAATLPWVCVNPDLSVLRGENEVLCAGTLAEAYAARGGDVRYHGKPHQRAYEACFRHLEGVPRRRILAVGDSLRTDIAGALAADLDALLVTSGIHADALGIAPGEAAAPERIEALCAKAGVEPLGAMASLRW